MIMPTGNNNKIVLDLRLIQAGGIGTYLNGLLTFWLPLLVANKSKVILISNSLTQEHLKQFIKSLFPNHQWPVNFMIEICDDTIFSLREQFDLLKISFKYRPQQWFSPHLNAPWLAMNIRDKTDFIVVIHDSIMFQAEFNPSNLTSRFKAKFLTLIIKLKRDYFRALTVSNTAAESIENLFQLKAKVISPILLLPINLNFKTRRDNYFVLIGQNSKHKGWSELFDQLTQAKFSGEIKVLGPKKLKAFTWPKFVNLITQFSETKKYEILSQAQALIFPSLAEGFGLPPLEALRVGTPVILNNIPVLREIYSSDQPYPGVYFFQLNKTGDFLKVCEQIKILNHSDLSLKTNIQSFWQKYLQPENLWSQYLEFLKIQ